MAELTTSFFINQANAFVSDVNDTRNSYFVFASKSLPWDNESNPPAANNSLEETNLSVYRDLLFGKLLANSDISILIPRYNWVFDTVYSEYDQTDADLYSKIFFVVNDQYEVFKCISNNRGAKSTVEPRLNTVSGTFNTADGYVWKYMYTIDAQSYSKFASADYIPVTINADVAGNAVPGTIDAYRITDGGNNYSVYESGFVFKLINKTTLQLPSTSSPNNDHYARSSIYLKSGFGAGQIREISSYNGATKQIRIATSDPFEIYTRLDFTGIPSGTVETGYFAEQKYDIIQYLYVSNNQAFTTGSTIIQSDSGNSGIVLSANSTTLRVQRTNSNSGFSLTSPIRDASQAGTSRTGTVSVTAGSNVVTGTTTQFTTGYTVGSYIRVGGDANNNIRRITAVTNNISLRVASNFESTLVANTHFLVPIAAEPISITANQGASGIVSNTNLNSLRLTISNSTLAGVTFTVGEEVRQVTSANTNAGANGIVAFANSTTVYLSSVEGSWVANLFALGTSSLQKSQISSIDSNPNLTLRDPEGDFVLGFPVNFKLSPTANSSDINAIVIATTTLPNDQTEYQIAPTVVITGDGSGAKAIAVVNTAVGSVNEVVGIDVINPGQNYTYANVSIYANTVFGSGATALPIIAPIGGHGKNAIEELGGRYVGITSQFDNGTNEGFFYPTYGSYRKIGIIENPEFNDVIINVDSYDRIRLNLANKVTSSPNVSITNWVTNETVVQPSSYVRNTTLTISGSNTFTIGEQVFQPSGTSVANLSVATAVGTVEYANTTKVLISNTSGTFDAVTAVRGATSNLVSTPSSSNLEFGILTAAGSGTVVSGNSTVLELKNVQGEFNGANLLYGFTSNTFANVTSSAIIRFQETSDSIAEIVSQVGSGARGEITSVSNVVSNNTIVMSNVVGKFVTGDTIFDASVNAYAVVNTIFTAGGSRDVTSSFGNKFNQTMRFTLTSNTGSFTNNEVVIQNFTNASAVVVSDRNELDLAMTISSGTFTTGQRVTSASTGAYGYVVSANSTYLKLTGVTTDVSFAIGHTINNELGSTATVDGVYPVLLLNDVDGSIRFQTTNTVVGQTSGATGECNSYSLILYPELVRDTGRVIYLDNVQPVTRSDLSKEEIRLVIKF